MQTGRALRRAAALAEGALLYGQGRLTALGDLPGEVPVAAGDLFLVPLIDRPAQGEVHALGVPLQADDQRQLFIRRFLRQKQLADHLHMGLALEQEADAGTAGAEVLRPLDAEMILFRALHGQAQKLRQPGAGFVLPCGQVLIRPLSHGEAALFQKFHVSVPRIKRHRQPSRKNGLISLPLVLSHPRPECYPVSSLDRRAISYMMTKKAASPADGRERRQDEHC